MVQLRDVFGITTNVPTHTYVDRQGLDGQFRHLLSSDRHIVIYGASKQGKTSLRRKQLPEDECVIVPCQPEFKLSDIYQEIRRQLDVRSPSTLKISSEGSGHVNAHADGKIGLPFVAQGGVSGELQGAFKNGSETTYTAPSTDMSLVFIAECLKEANKRLVIEDFHYLVEDERRKFAFDLKALWDMSVFVIIVGVWAEQNLLNLYNNDLTGRIEEIDIQWSTSDLQSVLSNGEIALKIDISNQIKDAMVGDVSDNVGLLQIMAERLCLIENIVERGFQRRRIFSFDSLTACRQKICSGQENRYQGFADIISKGFKDPERTKLKMYHHLVRVCFEGSDSELLSGIDRQVLLSRIQFFEPDANLSVLSAALSRLNRLQSDRRISPPVLVYNDIGRKVALVDRELLFYRRYKNTQWPWERSDYLTDLNFDDLLQIEDNDN